MSTAERLKDTRYKSPESKAKTARKFGVQIADANSIEALSNLSVELEDAYAFGGIYSLDYEKLTGYIRHRRIVLKHKKSDIAETLDERIDSSRSEGSINTIITAMYDYHRKGSLSDTDFAYLHSKACRKFEQLNSLSPKPKNLIPKKEVSNAAII